MEPAPSAPEAKYLHLSCPSCAVYSLFSAMQSTSPLDPASGLGGNLLYAGDIVETRPLLIAANIAGAASLAASADPAIQRQAMRDGVIDFLVTSLEEALRILKNEIRKRQTVSVGVSISSANLTAAMLHHGVLPDLLPPANSTTVTPSAEKFVPQGARQISVPSEDSRQYVTWTVDQSPLHWLPRLDACAVAILPAEDHLRRRWLRFAPRYLGRQAQREHGLALTPQEAELLQIEMGRVLRTEKRADGSASALLQFKSVCASR